MNKRSRRSHLLGIRWLPAGVVAGLLAVAVVCAYAVTVTLGGSAPAVAAPSAPGFLGEVLGAEMPASVVAGWDDGELRGVAVENTSGDVWVTTGIQLTNEAGRVVELTPYGVFVRELGREVDETKVKQREAQEAAKESVTVTKQEENICTAASGDACAAPKSGTGAGDTQDPATVAVEQSTGALYVGESDGGGRIVKFAKSGAFVFTIGGQVDKTKVEKRKREEADSEPVTVSKEEENICTAASGDECQEAASGSGPGEFSGISPFAQQVAIGGPEEHLYVGDRGRVQVFNSSGHEVGEDSVSSLSASGTVHAVSVDSSGDVFFADQGVAGVHELEPNGTLSVNVYDPSSTGVEALAVDDSGHLFAVDSQPSRRALEYEVASPGSSPSEFGSSEPGKLGRSAQGIAVDPSGTVYLLTEARVLMFGSLPAMEAMYGAPDIKPTVVSQTASIGGAEASEATLQAGIDPQLSPTSYQFEYGPEPCSLDHCVKTPARAAPVGSATKADDSVTATATGLVPGKVYYFRATASNAAGQTMAAEAAMTVGKPWVAGVPGLPDGRHYELVSPPNKFGNSVLPDEGYALASPSGDSFLFSGNGAMGSGANSGDYVATRTTAGWSTTSALPLIVGAERDIDAQEVVPSESFSHFVFVNSENNYSTSEPLGPLGSVNIFLWEPPAGEVAWLGEPAISNPLPAPGDVNRTYVKYAVAGATPDLSTVYFTALPTLVPQDQPRAANFSSFDGELEGPWGFYEWSEGKLASAGVLPNGNVSPYGAVPAATWETADNNVSEPTSLGSTPSAHENEVSENGEIAFFVSPAPRDQSLAHEPTELYARVTGADGGKRTVLVSRSELPGREGQAAPDGPLAVGDAVGDRAVGNEQGAYLGSSYVFASGDGEHAFFSSIDRLTSSASASNEAKEYEYDLETGVLTYLPGVEGAIVAVASNGSDLVFEDKGESPRQLKLWTAGASGGSVRPIAQLPIPSGASYSEREQNIATVQMSRDGSVVAFETNAAIPGGFNDGGGFWQLYRYSTNDGELSCVSCAPAGQVPIGNTISSLSDSTEVEGSGHMTPFASRVLSEDGSRLFFSSPNALVAQAVDGKRNVYEWEDGTVYLISSGTSTEDSYLSGSGADGSDVFFTTTSGLVPQDTDGAYDVYDARIPHPGDTPPPAAVPCEGAVCQGPASTPQLLGAPASETFSGAGDVAATARTVGSAGTAKKGATQHGKKTHKRRKRRKAKAKKRAGHATKARGKRDHKEGRGKR